MKFLIQVYLVFAFLVVFPAILVAQSTWTPEEEQVMAAINRLSASTAPDGGGADDYAKMLDDSFTRWTVGSVLVNDKSEWIEGMRDWFDDGWRVTERQTDYLDIHIADNFAFTRRNVSETYLGPDGDTSTSKAAVAEVWKKSGPGWLLLLANVHPIVD